MADGTSLCACRYYDYRNGKFYSTSSQTLKAEAKSYVHDIRETKGGKPYLMITERRFKDKDEEPELPAYEGVTKE